MDFLKKLMAMLGGGGGGGGKPEYRPEMPKGNQGPQTKYRAASPVPPPRAPAQQYSTKSGVPPERQTHSSSTRYTPKPVGPQQGPTTKYTPKPGGPKQGPTTKYSQKPGVPPERKTQSSDTNYNKRKPGVPPERKTHSSGTTYPPKPQPAQAPVPPVRKQEIRSAPQPPPRRPPQREQIKPTPTGQGRTFRKTPMPSQDKTGKSADPVSGEGSSSVQARKQQAADAKQAAQQAAQIRQMKDNVQVFEQEHMMRKKSIQQVKEANKYREEQIKGQKGWRRMMGIAGAVAMAPFAIEKGAALNRLRQEEKATKFSGEAATSFAKFNAEARKRDISMANRTSKSLSWANDKESELRDETQGIKEGLGNLWNWVSGGVSKVGSTALWAGKLLIPDAVEDFVGDTLAGGDKKSIRHPHARFLTDFADGDMKRRQNRAQRRDGRTSNAAQAARARNLNPLGPRG